MQQSNLLCLLFSLIAFDVLSSVYSASTILPRAIESTGVDEAVESETVPESRDGLTNIPLHATAKALVKKSSDADVDIANAEETTDDDLASKNLKARATPLPKGDKEHSTLDGKNDYAETMEPEQVEDRIVTKARIDEETPMLKGKGMSPVVPSAGGKTEMPRLGATDDDDDDKNDYAEGTSMPKDKGMSPVVPRAGGETEIPRLGATDDDADDKNDYAEGTSMPKGKGMSPVVPRAAGGETEIPLDTESSEEDEESEKSKKESEESNEEATGAARIATMKVESTGMPHKIAAGSLATVLPLEALESATKI